MSRERHDAIVQEFERELRQALAVEPSPDFTRGVRARIAGRAAASALRRRRLYVALAAAAACVVAIGVGWRATTVRPLPGAAATRAGMDVHLPAVSAASAQNSAPRETAATTRPPDARPEPGPSVPPEPVAIVPPDRARALARFLALARSGAVDEDSLRPVVAAAAPVTLNVEPLVVPSIAVPTVHTQTGVPEEGPGRE